MQDVIRPCRLDFLKKNTNEKTMQAGKFPKINKREDVIRLCRLDFFKKLIICAALLLDTLE